MRAVLRLQILLGVPIRIEEQHRVRGREVDALAAGASAEQKDPRLRVWLVEGEDLLLALGLWDRAVDAAAGPGAQHAAVRLEEVELRLELREDEDFVAFGEEIRE